MDIKPTNNARGLKVSRIGFFGEKVKIVADFGRSGKQTSVLSRKKLLNAIKDLNDGQFIDFRCNLIRVHQMEDKLRLFFKSVNDCDLVVALKSDVIEALI